MPSRGTLNTEPAKVQDLPRNPAIREALNRTMTTPDASVLVVGYAANGRDHAGKSLDVIHEALKSKTLAAGSTVVLHVSGHGQNSTQLEALERLQVELHQAGVSVVLAAAPRSLQDALSHDQLSVFKKTRKINDLEQASLLEAGNPTRKLSPAAQNDVLTASLRRLQHMPTLETKDLMDGLRRIVGEEGMAAKVKVLTDANHSLQKAAEAAGVSPGNRLNQQKNDVGFKIRFGKKGAAAGLASAFREEEKQMLGEMQKVLGEIGAKRGESRAKVRDKTVNFLLEKAKDAAGEKINGQTQGVLCHRSVWHNYPKKPQIKNIVYISDQHHQELIADHVKRRLAENPPPQAYKETMFVFCGRDAVPGVDSMALAQVADADGIFNRGAAEDRRYGYLSARTGSRAMAMAVNSPTAKAKTVSAQEFLQGLDDSVERWRDAAEDKYDEGNNIKRLNSRINRSSSVSAAHNALFGTGGKKEQGDQPIVYIDPMRNRSTERANEKFQEMMSQIISSVRERACVEKGERERQALELSLGWKSETLSLSLIEIAEMLEDKGQLMGAISDGRSDRQDGQAEVAEQDILFLEQMRTYLRIVADDESPREQLEADRQAYENGASEPTTPTFMALRELEQRIYEMDERQA